MNEAAADVVRCSVCGMRIPDVAFSGPDGAPRCLDCTRAPEAQSFFSRCCNWLWPRIVDRPHASKVCRTRLVLSLLIAMIFWAGLDPLIAIWLFVPYLFVVAGIDKLRVSPAVCGCAGLPLLLVTSPARIAAAPAYLVIAIYFLVVSTHALWRRAEFPAADGAQAPRPDAERGRLLTVGWAAWFVLYALALVTLNLFRLPSSVMEDTISEGETIAVEALSHHFLPIQRGEVIAIRYPVDDQMILLQRVLGVPGDRVRIAERQLWVNGEQIDEPYAVFRSTFPNTYRDNLPSEPSSGVYDGAVDMLKNHVEGESVVVPPNSYFLLGDNRDFSLDSRYFGFIETGQIFGRPFHPSLASGADE